MDNNDGVVNNTAVDTDTSSTTTSTPPPQVKCKTHVDKIVVSYCQECDSLMCSECELVDPHDHETKRKSVESLLKESNVSHNIHLLFNRMCDTVSTIKLYREDESKINNVFKQLHELLEKEQSALLSRFKKEKSIQESSLKQNYNLLTKLYDLQFKLNNQHQQQLDINNDNNQQQQQQNNNNNVNNHQNNIKFKAYNQQLLEEIMGSDDQEQIINNYLSKPISQREKQGLHLPHNSFKSQKFKDSFIYNQQQLQPDLNNIQQDEEKHVEQNDNNNSDNNNNSQQQNNNNEIVKEEKTNLEISIETIKEMKKVNETVESKINFNVSKDYTFQFNSMVKLIYDIKTNQNQNNQVAEDETIELFKEAESYYIVGENQTVELKEKAFKLFNQCVEKQYSLSYARVGQCYQTGYGVEKDLTKVLKWYRMSIDQGHHDTFQLMEKFTEHCYNIKRFVPFETDFAENVNWYLKHDHDSTCQHIIGRAYEVGKVLEKNLSLSFEWYMKSANAGNAIGCYNVGFGYEFAIGVEKNQEKSMEWYLKSAENGCGKSQFNIAYSYANGTGGRELNFAKAMEWYIKSAANGSVDSMTNIGKAYELGNGVTKNVQTAFEWYMKSATNGNPMGQFNVGVCYKYGRGVEKSLVKSYEWFKKGSDNGSVLATNSLGIAMEDGIGCEVNHNLAFEHYKKSADANDPNAQTNLANAYKKGIGCNIDLKAAFEYYTKGANASNNTAIYNLGVIYEQGTVVPQDYNKAFEYYRRAAEAGLIDAQYDLSRMYSNGYGVEKSLVRAFEWMKRSSENGYTEAHVRLGQCYEYGLGCEVDYHRAFSQYKRAADSNHPEGLYLYGLAFENGIGTNRNLTKSQEYFKQSSLVGYQLAKHKILPI